MKRLERITIEEEPSSNQQIDERQVKSGTERRRLFAKKVRNVNKSTNCLALLNSSRTKFELIICACVFFMQNYCLIVFF